MRTVEKTTSTATAARQAWLAILAHAPRALLADRAAVDEAATGSFEALREPEVGLVMVQGRIGGTGDRFNLGETTLTRCVVRHRDADGRATAGVGYVRGRDPERARWIARFDALLQQPGHHERVMRDVIEPLRRAVADERTAAARRTAASRVRFFTLASPDA